MKSTIKCIASVLFIGLTACSTQAVQESTRDQTDDIKPTTLSKENALPNSFINPPLKIMKGNKSLNLVRIMDGSVCKNNFQGVKGEFLIYADPNDIERLKQEKTPEIFKDFENKIQVFSSRALQEAIEATNLAEDPFSLGEDDAQQKLTSQLVINFRNAAHSAVSNFQKETTLTIEIAPFSPSFIFYRKGCDMNHINPES